MVAANDYTLGRGKLYFDKFVPGTKVGIGEEYIGNTPALTMTSTTTNLDHFSSDEGIRVKDASVQLQTDRSGTFQTDNISAANLALLFGTTPVDRATTAATALTNSFTVTKGRYYQLGVTVAVPEGVRNALTATIMSGTVPAAVLAPTNWELDIAKGRIHIFDDAPGFDDGDTMTVTYSIGINEQTIIIDEGDVTEGSLRYIADNPEGTDRDYFWPDVKLSPNGAYAMKGDTWMVIDFNFEVLVKDFNTKRVYVST